MNKKKLVQIFPKKIIQIGNADPIPKKEEAAKDEEVWDDLEERSEEEEYEIVEKEILPAKIICPDCGGITLEGLEFCDKCGGELQPDSKQR